MNMSELTLDDDDLTPTQEYLIAGIVILLFGFLYWLFNYGWNSDSDFVSTPPTPPPQLSTIRPATQPTAELASVDTGISSQTAALGTAGAVAAVATTPDSASEAANTAIAPPVEKKIKGDFRVKADEKVATAPVPALTPEEESRINSTGEALKLAEIDKLKAAEESLQQAKAEASEAEAETRKLAEKIAQSPTAQSPTAQSTGKPAGTVYKLPDGTEIKLASTGFEAAFKNALEKGEINKPIIFDQIYFDSGSSKIKAKSEHQIQATAALLNTYPDAQVLIRGHSDNKGLPANNAQLSLMRANEMGLALGRLGINTRRIRILGMGDTDPIASNRTAKGRNKNRRIEIVITVAQ
jgi:outer membrane protein OmpA-like peptidoglycan-associated protein